MTNLPLRDIIIPQVYGNATCKDILTSFDGKPITYDAQGNPISYLGHQLTWEKGRQLKSFDGNTYTYNANGIRTKKVVNGLTHNYALDGSMVLYESWDTNTLAPLYDNEDAVCGIIYNDKSFYFQKNLQDDVIAITDDAGNIVVRYSYDAWGVCSIMQDISDIDIATINPYKYRSYYFDNETKLYYLQSRYYDPKTGRFLNFDSPEYINFTGTVASNNLSCYCENNPVNATDYFGHSWFKDKIVNKVKTCAQKAAKAVKETAATVVKKVQTTSKVVAKAVKTVAETVAGASAKKATTILVKGIAGISTAVISNPETKTKIKNIAGHVIDTINNETARDFWNIYVVELGSTVLKELTPVAVFTWASARAAVAKCLKNKGVSTLKDDWNTYLDNVTKILLGMSESVSKILDIYKKMKVEPISLNNSNANFTSNISEIFTKTADSSGNLNFNLNKSWYFNHDFITRQGGSNSQVAGLKCGDGYLLTDTGCGFIASYNVGKFFGRVVDLPSVVYWYEQNSGLTMGGIIGVNPYKIEEFVKLLNLQCELINDIDRLEESRLTKGGVYIVCQWNNANNMGDAAHYYMVEASATGIQTYNNSSMDTKSPKDFYETLDGGSLICAFRIYE